MAPQYLQPHLNLCLLDRPRGSPTHLAISWLKITTARLLHPPNHTHRDRFVRETSSKPGTPMSADRPLFYARSTDGMEIEENFTGSC